MQTQGPESTDEVGLAQHPFCYFLAEDRNRLLDEIIVRDGLATTHIGKNPAAQLARFAGVEILHNSEHALHPAIHDNFIPASDAISSYIAQPPQSLVDHSPRILIQQLHNHLDALLLHNRVTVRT